MFTARYALSPYIKQTSSVFKRLIMCETLTLLSQCPHKGVKHSDNFVLTFHYPLANKSAFLTAKGAVGSPFRFTLTLRLLMSYIYIYIYIYIYMEHLFLMFLDHTQRRTTVGGTPLDE